MFNDLTNFQYKYAPILAIKPAEMTALEELPEKDRDLMLPIIPLKGWVRSEKLENSMQRIEKAFGKRSWIADIDKSFLENKQEYTREVFNEIKNLLDPTNGYDNWYKYLKSGDYDHIIPTIQLGDISQIETQVDKLNSLNRGLAVKITWDPNNPMAHAPILDPIKEKELNNIFVIFDCGQIKRNFLESAAGVSNTVEKAHDIIPSGLFAISCSSFPSSFSGEEKGKNSICERLLYNLVSKSCDGVRMIYSDRASARAEKIRGGGAIPSPRIDYPLKVDWRFIRKEFENSSSPGDGEKEELYTQIAKIMMKQDYWKSDLRIWGTQVIELTSRGEMLGINSAIRSTAVRINIHMHQQLYYDLEEMPDTDEDWQD